MQKCGRDGDGVVRFIPRHEVKDRRVMFDTRCLEARHDECGVRCSDDERR